MATRAGSPTPGTGNRLSALRHVREVLIIAGAYFTYMVVRRFLISDIESIAFDHARQLIAFELATGIFAEPQWQRWALANAKGLVVFLNWAYIITFAPIMIVIGVAAYLRDRPRYIYYRNVFLLSFVFALILFAWFPLAPPRFLPEYGSVDTIRHLGGLASWYGGREMAVAIYYNVYAAMPSLHFGWTILFGLLMFRTRNKALKVFGILYPTVTFFAITLTGNHYILDAAGGGAVALASHLLYEGLLRANAPVSRALSAARSSRARAGAKFQAKYHGLKSHTALLIAITKYRYRLWRETARNRKGAAPSRFPF